MIALLILIAEFFVVASLVVIAFWIVQIRFGTIDDLDESSTIVRAIRRKKIEAEAFTVLRSAPIKTVSNISGFAAPVDVYAAVPEAIIYQRASTAIFSISDLRKTHRSGKRPQKEEEVEATVRDYRYPDAQTRMIEQIDPLVSRYVQ